MFCVDSKSGMQDAHIVAIMEADNFLTMLHDLSAMGAAMRRVMTASLTNPQVRVCNTFNPKTTSKPVHLQNPARTAHRGAGEVSLCFYVSDG